MQGPRLTRKRKLTVAAGAALAGAVAFVLLAPDGRDTGGAVIPPGGPGMVAVAVPAQLSGEARLGQRVFDANCAACHGANAAGQEGVAPPLVHRIYEPGHHGDFAFQRAVRLGVRSHHWRFGDMPPVEGLSDTDIARATLYVRELQRENGIR